MKAKNGKPSANILKKAFFFKNSTWIRFGKKIRYRLGPLQSLKKTRETNGDTAVGNVWRVLQKFPRTGKLFFKNAKNKKELFIYLSSVLSTRQLPDQNEQYITEEDCVKHLAEGTPMGQCNHEETDTCKLVHLSHALQTKSIGLIHTGNTDILANHPYIISAHPAVDIWIYFHAGKSKRIINFNSVAANLGEETWKSMALFHTLTGSHSTTAFKFKGKRSFWNILQNVPYVNSFRNLQKSQMPNIVYP